MKVISGQNRIRLSRLTPGVQGAETCGLVPPQGPQTCYNFKVKSA